MVQLADTIGERGVTALMALAAGLLASGVRLATARTNAPATAQATAQTTTRTTRTRGAIAIACAVLVPLATLGFGALRIRQVDSLRAAAPTARIALVQPSIGATDRWEERNAAPILARLTDFTRRAEARGASLTIWPEASYPYPVAHASRRAPIDARAILQPGVRGPVLTGLVMTGGPGGSYNSAVVATADGAVSEPYDKMHLVWFGETVPFADRIAWLRTAFARGMGLVPGDHQVSLVAGPVRAAVLNCFEDTLPESGLEAIATRPNLLVNVTNDAWFLGTSESELHLRLSALRAVEHRRDLVRAVNGGPTSWVDAAGRVRARLGPELPGTLMTEPALLESAPTLFSRFGDLPCVLLVAAAVAARALSTRARTKREGRRAPARSGDGRP
jgi:apolipoprotein N-acyltransferase